MQFVVTMNRVGVGKYGWSIHRKGELKSKWLARGVAFGRSRAMREAEQTIHLLRLADDPYTP